MVAALSLAVLSACAGNGTAEQAAEAETTADTGETGTTTDAVETDATTETGPPPITAGEERWAQELEKLANRMSRPTDRARLTYTDALIARLAKVYATCLPTLKRAGSPGRLEPAARTALRACMRFEQSANRMSIAVALQAAGIDSQEKADRYSALVSQSIEAQGNGSNAMERARMRAEEISSSLPPE